MNSITEKMVATAIDMDTSISQEQRILALRILKHGVTAALSDLPRQDGERSSCEPKSAASKPYLRRHQAAKYLGCSVRQIDQMKQEGELPFHRLGRRLVIFKAEDLEQLMSKHRSRTDDVVTL